MTEKSQLIKRLMN